jgi:hypothetical protein
VEADHCKLLSVKAAAVPGIVVFDLVVAVDVRYKSYLAPETAGINKAPVVSRVFGEDTIGILQVDTSFHPEHTSFVAALTVGVSVFVQGHLDVAGRVGQEQRDI